MTALFLYCRTYRQHRLHPSKSPEHNKRRLRGLFDATLMITPRLTGRAFMRKEFF